MIFIDTNIAIEILNGNTSLNDLFIQLSSEKIGITTPSIVELYNYIMVYTNLNI